MLGNVISILLAVVLLAASFLTTSLSFSDFGLDFVPALLGETEAVDVDRRGRVLGVGDAGDAKSERRHTGDEEGLAQGETPPGGLVLDWGARAEPHRAADY